MATVTHGIKQPNELSGFGFPEAATAVEVCTRDDCYANNQPLVTDLYCRSHGRLMPLISAPTGLPVLIAIISSLIIYGCFEITAETNSRLPVYIIYAILGFGFLVIPLRHFIRAAIITSAIWVSASIIPIISSYWSGHFKVVFAAGAIFGIMLILAVYAITGMPHAALPRSATREERIIARIIAVALIIAIWSGAASLALHYESYIFPGSEERLTRFMLITALISLAASALIISATSVVIGVRKMKLQVRTPSLPNRPRWRRTPRVGNASSSSYNARGPLAAVAIFARTIALAAVAAINALFAIGTIIVNCVIQIAYVLTYVVLALFNVLVRFAVLTARWVQATIESVARLSFYALLIACYRIFDPIASVFVPLAALVSAPWLVLVLADQTRMYLLHGSLMALRTIAIVALATAALLLGSWVIVANQHPRDSLRSFFERSAPVTIAYGFVILFFGGWLLAFPRVFGWGRIHVGRVTLWSSGLVIFVLLVLGIIWLARFNRSNLSTSSPSTPPTSPPGLDNGGRAWTIGVALVMIASTVTSLAILTPWTGVELAPPVGMTVDSWSTNSVTISWSGPASGPLPAYYVILQNGHAIASVPGLDTSYRAIGLTPSTRYTYQVSAVRGAHRSPWSPALTETTSVPALWMAPLTGQWSVAYKNIVLNGVTNVRLTTDTWVFSPNCATSNCAVTLKGHLSGFPFTANLHHSRGIYTGETRETGFLSCGSNPSAGVLILHIHALKGEIVKGHWIVSSWTGSMTYSTPAATCTASQVTANINASQ